MFFGIESCWFDVVSKAVYQTERWRMLSILLQRQDIELQSLKIGVCHLPEVNIDFDIYMTFTKTYIDNIDYSDCYEVTFNGQKDIQDVFIHRCDVETITIDYEEDVIDTWLYLLDIEKSDFADMTERLRTSYYNI